MSNAIKSQGASIVISNENAASTVYGSATFATIGEVVTIGEPDGAAAVIDTTSLQSTSKEFLMGLPDNGKIALTMNALNSDAGFTQLYAAKAAQQLRWIRITRSDSAVRYFKAVVLKMVDIGMAVDGKVTASAELQISGDITNA